MPESASKVLVTGACGYLGSHCVQQLLLAGYSVRATLRNCKNEPRLAALLRLDGASERLELVEAELQNRDDWPKAVEGCTFILHLASPIGGDETIVQTAVEGTLNVLRAASQNGHVKKVVMTGSCISVSYGRNRDHVFTEADWTNLDSDEVKSYRSGIVNYMRSKMLAEQAGWAFMKALPESAKLKLTVLIPGFIIGPVLGYQQCSSVKTIAELLRGVTADALVYKRQVPHSVYVDVRDVARAHVRAMDNARSNGERILLCSNGLWQVEAASAIEKEFESHGYQIPTAHGEIPPDGERLYFKYDTTKAHDLLGLSFIPSEQTLVDMCHTLIEHGIVTKKPDYCPRKPFSQG